MSPELINKVVELNKTKELLEEVLNTKDSKYNGICICKSFLSIPGYCKFITDEKLNNKLTNLVVNFCQSELDKISQELNNLTC